MNGVGPAGCEITVAFEGRHLRMERASASEKDRSAAATKIERNFLCVISPKM